MKCPVIALAQLSRAVEQREDKHPILSDLRESGQIEADADQIWFPFRDRYYQKNKQTPAPGEVEVVELDIAKFRSGAAGMVRLGFQADYARFVNLTTNNYDGRAW